MIDIVSEINKNLSIGQVAEYSEITAELNKLSDQFGSVVPDCSNREGYEFSKNAALTCRDIRSNLEAVRKDKKQPYLDYSRLIDSQAKFIKEKLESIEGPHKEAYQEVDARKKAELEARKQIIVEMNNIRLWATDKDEFEISEKIDEIACLDVSKSTFGRLLDDAMSAQQTATEVLYACHADAVNRRAEAEQAEKDRLELEALRAAKAKADQEEADRIADQERLAYEEGIKARALEQAKLDADQAALESKQREEAAIIASKQAEDRLAKQEFEAEQALVDAEVRRVADIEAAKQAESLRLQEAAAKEQAEANARETDKKHKASIHNAILGSMVMGGVSEDQAKLVVKLIAANKIPHTKISY